MLRIENGDLWKHYARGAKVVVTTNIGWDPATRRNNMGAGVALQAWQRWPELAEWYGRFCRATYPRTPVVEHPTLRLIFLPVKPLISIERPEQSWAQDASLSLITRGLRRLRLHKGEIVLAFPGCGNGGLDQAMVLPVLTRTLTEDRFTVVDRDWAFVGPSPMVAH